MLRYLPVMMVIAGALVNAAVPAMRPHKQKDCPSKCCTSATCEYVKKFDTCDCPAGKYFDKTTNDCADQDSGSENCQTTRTCNPATETCKNVLTGTACSCRPGLMKQNNRCVCPTGQVLDWNGKCVAKSVFDAKTSCTQPGACNPLLETCRDSSSGSICSCKWKYRQIFGRCNCPFGYYANLKTMSCQPQELGAMHCNLAVTCPYDCTNTYTGIQCACLSYQQWREGYGCYCPVGQYYDEIAGECQAQNPNVDHCLTTTKCNDPVGRSCVNVKTGIECECQRGVHDQHKNLCKCIKPYYADAETNRCERQQADAKNCKTHSNECDSSTEQCVNTRDGITCVCFREYTRIKVGEIYGKAVMECRCPHGQYDDGLGCYNQKRNAPYCTRTSVNQEHKVCINTKNGVKYRCMRGYASIVNTNGVSICSGACDNCMAGACDTINLKCNQCAEGYFYNDLVGRCAPQNSGVSHCLITNTCNPTTEKCVDNIEGYTCLCKPGQYKDDQRQPCAGWCSNCKTGCDLVKRTCDRCKPGFYFNDDVERCLAQVPRAPHCSVDNPCHIDSQICKDGQTEVYCVCKPGFREVNPYNQPFTYWCYKQWACDLECPINAAKSEKLALRTPYQAPPGARNQ